MFSILVSINNSRHDNFIYDRLAFVEEETPWTENAKYIGKHKNHPKHQSPFFNFINVISIYSLYAK